MRRKLLISLVVAVALLTSAGATAAFAAGTAFQEGESEPGLVIVRVDPDGPAADAGIKRGDILLELDGQEINQGRQFLKAVRSLEPGDEVDVLVLHGDDERTLSVTVGDRNGQPYLGLQPYMDGQEMMLGPLMERLGEEVPGAVIAEVVEDSPAAKAGLKVGDIIVAVDAKKLDATNGLAEIIGSYKPGDKISLEVARAEDLENTRKVMVTLGKNPDDAAKALLGVRYTSAPSIETLEDEMLPVEPDTMPFVMPQASQGAVVRDVVKDSPAEKAGLQAGDVIIAIDDKEVSGPQALVDAVGNLEPGAEVVLTVARAGEDQEMEIEVTLGEHPDGDGKAYLGVSLRSMLMRMFGLPQGNSSQEDFELPFDLDQLPLPFQRTPQLPG